ncbi:MAG: hypothetical protein ACKO0Z_24890 [Betaproteobacteria bacterium]
MTLTELYLQAQKKLNSLSLYRQLTMCDRYAFYLKSKTDSTIRIHSIIRKSWADVEATWKKQNPKKRKMPESWDCDFVDNVFAPYRTVVERMEARKELFQAKWEKQIREASEGIVIPEGDWTLLRAIHEGEYGSQGYGAVNYASGAASQLAQDCIAMGVKAEVRRTLSDGKPALATFEVWVACDSIWHEAIRNKPARPLKEWVAACWKSGTNPRVYNPFLPHGYEEANGIDYFGNTITPEQRDAKQLQKRIESMTQEQFLPIRFVLRKMATYEDKELAAEQRKEIADHLRWLKREYTREIANRCHSKLLWINCCPSSPARSYWRNKAHQSQETK